MNKNQIKPCEMYKFLMDLLESDTLPLDQQQFLIETLKPTAELKRIIDGFSPEDRQYDYENYLVGLNDGSLPFEPMELSFVVYQFQRHGIDTKLLELHIDMNASKLEEFRGFKVPLSDIRFYEQELKKVIARHPRCTKKIQ